MTLFGIFYYTQKAGQQSLFSLDSRFARLYIEWAFSVAGSGRDWYYGGLCSWPDFGLTADYYETSIAISRTLF
jgi:hypothetical protein